MEYFINTEHELKHILKKRIVPKIEELLKEKVTLLKDKINWKLSGGGKFKPHQDHGAYNDFPPEYYVTAALSLDISTVENGCLEMVKGRHKEGILDNKNGDITDNLVSLMNWEPILATPRDLLLFDSFVPHRSDINKTKNPRRIFYFTFNKEKEGDYYEKYFSKKRKEFPPDCEREEGINYNLNCKYNLANPMN
jgi:ectoine hydroxylase-related dioxygenase (phytanoyl-CoA dioxygenase family)